MADPYRRTDSLNANTSGPAASRSWRSALGLPTDFASTRTVETAREGEATSSVTIDHVSAYYRTRMAIRDVSLGIADRKVTAIIGPSGCGKSTLLRTVNRMHEVIPGARVEGSI